jgi:hypothetical protein
MADKYTHRSGIATRVLSPASWIASELTPILLDVADEHKDCIILTGWKRRFEGSKGGYYEGALRDATGELYRVPMASYIGHVGGIADSRLGLCTVNNSAALPLLPVTALQTTSAMSLFSMWMAKNYVTPSYNPDDLIIGWMNALQSLIFQLASVDQGTRSTLEAIKAVHQGICTLRDSDPEVVHILSQLRNDSEAEDTLQRICSAIHLKRPFHQTERLRMLETVLKRTFKRHKLLHDDVKAVRGLFATLSVVPVVTGYLSGVLPLERATQLINERRALLTSRLQTAIQVVPVGGDGGWHYVVGKRTDRQLAKKKEREMANLDIDSSLLYGLITSETGLRGTSLYALSRLLVHCSLPRNLGVTGDFVKMGFVLDE